MTISADNEQRQVIIKRLLDKGVKIPCPESVEIDPEISTDRISGNGVTIHTGCKLFGSGTLISEGVELGYEAPVTIENCQLGRDVKLKGGFYYDSTFLDGSGMGSAAQIREACLLEEGARGAHTVGLKQTILMPFVTLGSLINFCDCLMSGGTDEKNHSEVGSSYIHFNYTPNQDKATASLIGDVPRGVMLNQPAIFLGGQGGLVGPVRIEYGTIVAAGSIVRKDVLKGNVMLFSQTSFTKSVPIYPGLFSNIKRIISLNTNYIAQLIALRRWYLDIRSLFIFGDSMREALFKGAIEKIDMSIDERLKRLGQIAERMPRSIEIYRQTAGEKASEIRISRKKEFHDRWGELKDIILGCLDLHGASSKREKLTSSIETKINQEESDYIHIIKGLQKEDIDLGISWLQGIVDNVNQEVWGRLPSFG